MGILHVLYKKKKLFKGHASFRDYQMRSLAF